MRFAGHANRGVVGCSHQRQDRCEQTPDTAYARVGNFYTQIARNDDPVIRNLVSSDALFTYGLLSVCFTFITGNI